tara:strand:+ start:1678 stop:1905 length:228 start_codon:yes stop_codon:yes gene_type:complete
MSSLKTVKTKTKRVCVTPLTIKAKNRFITYMDRFHTCTVENQQTKDGIKYFQLKALTREYYFWIPSNGDENWKIE